MRLRTWIPLFLALLAPGVYAWYLYFAFARPLPAKLEAQATEIAAAVARGDLAAGCAAMRHLDPLFRPSDLARVAVECRMATPAPTLREDLAGLADALRELRGPRWYEGRQSGAARLSLFVAVPAEILALLVILRYRRCERRLYAAA